MKGFKTVTFGLIVALLPLLDYVNSSDIFSNFISDPSKAKFATFAIGAMIIVLRAVTNTPLFKQSGFQQSGFKADEGVANVATDTPTDSTPTAVPQPSEPSVIAPTVPQSNETPVSEPSAIETPVPALDTPSILPTDTATDTKGA